MKSLLIFASLLLLGGTAQAESVKIKNDKLKQASRAFERCALKSFKRAERVDDVIGACRKEYDQYMKLLPVDVQAQISDSIRESTKAVFDQHKGAK